MGTGQTLTRGKHDELTQTIIGMFYDVYNELGHGFWSPSNEKPGVLP